jgi:choline kinase
MTTILIPAAGFGQRVGSPPAKELLIRPLTDRAFIDWPLELALKRNWRALVISRHDKISLNKYIEDYCIRLLSNSSDVNSLSIELLKISASTDWYDTLLQSKEYWSERNIIFLPDVQFAPSGILDQLDSALQENDLAVAVHSVEDSENWGHIYDINDRLWAAEKPKQKLPLKGFAWGLFGFQKNAGTEVLTAQWQSQVENKPQEIKKKCAFFNLESFSDLTRYQMSSH